MNRFPEGRAIVYCEGAFDTTYGKTAHGLVRRSERYVIVCVIDSRHGGRDAGELLDGEPAGIPVVESLDEALCLDGATHFVIGLAPDGGKLDESARADVIRAIREGLHVDSGLHDFLSEDDEIAALAANNGVRIRDVRKPPARKDLHFFDGRKIAEVDALRIALLGTDSAVGKRTTAWMLVDGLCDAGHAAQLVGTGQTAWLQGARHGIVLDPLVHDFVRGEIEHAVWSCFREEAPEVIVLEGQGSLMNPAYPGGMELLAAGRPHAVVLQHAPARRCYDGFPDFPLHPIERQIEAVRVLSDRPVVAIAINHENLTPEEARSACRRIRDETGVPATDVLLDGPAGLVDIVRSLLRGVET